jgi:hypothetical protein
VPGVHRRHHCRRARHHQQVSTRLSVHACAGGCKWVRGIFVLCWGRAGPHRQWRQQASDDSSAWPPVCETLESGS